MAETTYYDIPLFDIGVDGAGFRLENTPDELQRQHLDQYRRTDIKYQADLFAVTHGHMVPELSGHGDPRRGVLLIIDFHFASKPGKQRFKEVEISVAFSRENQHIGGPNDPIVREIAPSGTFGMDEATQNTVDVTEVYASAEGGNLAKLGIGSKFQRTTTSDTRTYAILNGMKWTEGRNTGTTNVANWNMVENSRLRHGVPPHLRVAILLELPDEARFRAELCMTANVGTLRSKIKRHVGARTGLDPVYFDPTETKKRDLGPTLSGVDKNNLSACNLDSIGIAKSTTIVAQETESVTAPKAPERKLSQSSTPLISMALDPGRAPVTDHWTPLSQCACFRCNVARVVWFCVLPFGSLLVAWFLYDKIQ